MRQLVQVVDPTTGNAQWVDRSTGEARDFVSRREGFPVVRAPVGEMLFETEPLIHEKLVNGRPLSWYEISKAADVILRAVSQDSLRVMFGGGSMRQMRSAIETMLTARRLCDALNPLSLGSTSVGVTAAADKRDAQGAMMALLHLPGQK
jgi:hypothetical protein